MLSRWHRYAQLTMQWTGHQLTERENEAGQVRHGGQHFQQDLSARDVSLGEVETIAGDHVHW